MDYGYLLWLLVLPFAYHSESVYCYNGQTYFYETLDKSSSELSIRNTVTFTEYRACGFTHRIKNHKNWTWSIDYSYNFNSPGFAVSTMSYGDGLDAFGLSIGIARSHYLSVGIQKTIYDRWSRLSISPGLYLKGHYVVLTSFDNTEGAGVGRRAQGVIGVAKWKSFPGIKPPLLEVRIPVNVRIWKGLSGCFLLGGSLGFAPTQDISYRWRQFGGPEHYIRSYITGTSIIVSFGLKYNY